MQAIFTNEQQHWLDKRFGELDKRVDELANKFDGLANKIDALHVQYGFQVHVQPTHFQLPDLFRGTECTICMEKLEGCGSVAITNCGHVFHWACLCCWKDQSINWPCPICRHCLFPTYFVQQSMKQPFMRRSDGWTTIGSIPNTRVPSSRHSGSWLGCFFARLSSQFLRRSY
jgi:hypothetical protein